MKKTKRFLVGLLACLTVGCTACGKGDQNRIGLKGGLKFSLTENGRVEEWNAIEKGNDWNYEVPATKVVCKDGEVEL